MFNIYLNQPKLQGQFNSWSYQHIIHTVDTVPIIVCYQPHKMHWIFSYHCGYFHIIVDISISLWIVNNV